MAKRSGTEIRTKIYSKFKGVDFTSDPSLVDDSRSPWATNIMADDGGMPEKRPGYRILHTLPDDDIEGGTIDKTLLGMTYVELRYDGVSNITSSTGITASVDPKTVYDKYTCTGSILVNTTLIGSTIYCYISHIAETLDSFMVAASASGIASLVSQLEECGITSSGWTAAGNQGVSFTIDHEDSHRHYMAVVKGKAIYRWYENTDPEIIYHDTGTLDPTPQFSCASFAYLNKKLVIFTGSEAFIYDGDSVKNLQTDAYVPITIIGRTASGGGDTYEGINYLTGKQEIRAMGDGTSTEFKLPYDSVNSVDKVVVNDVEQAASAWSYTAGEDHITFTTAPSSPSVSGQDNVYITFTHTIEGYSDHILKCRTCVIWGVGGTSDRIVATGNKKYPSQDYICGYNDPTYWPDTNYSVIGTGETAIKGYRRLGEQLAIIKEDNGQDSTVFMRQGILDSDGEATFTALPCLSGIGGVSLNGFGNILDDQMVLTGNGIYAIVTNSLTATQVAENRSVRIDPRLTKEDLTSAIVVNFQNKLMVFVNGKVYGLDGKQSKNYLSRNDINFTYEAFYWENIPAVAVMRTVTDGEEYLYFGDTSGHIYKFNTDISTMKKYSDERPVTFTATAALTEDSYVFSYDGQWKLDGETVTLSTYGITAPTDPPETSRITVDKTDGVYEAHYYIPIEAVWSTKADDDGDAMVYKTLLKKGNAVTIKPYRWSSAKIYMRTDKDAAEWLGNSGTMDIFSWEDIVFERFTFNSNDGPQEIPINRKVKNYKRLQIIVKNAVVNEGFGVYGIIKHYVTGNFAKR